MMRLPPINPVNPLGLLSILYVHDSSRQYIDQCVVVAPV